MAVISPFKGVLYDPQKVDPSKIMAPPYDVITPAFKNELYSRSPNNIVRVDFGKDSDDDNEDTNRYTRAANDISDWLTQGILTAEKDPCYYLYEIRYELEGQTLRTRGFLGAVKLEEISKGSIHPHEETYSKPKSDRLNIMRYCQANTSPIFSLFSSHKTGISEVMDRIAADKPYISAVDEDGSIHTLWKITGQDDMEIIRAEMSDRDIFIADGHHRYETALAFQKEMAEAGKSLTGDEPFNYVLMFLSNMEEEGLTLLPTHRIVEIDSDIHPKEALQEFFDIERIDAADTPVEAVRKHMFEQMKKKQHSFGMYLTNSDAYYIMSHNGKDLGLNLPECLKRLDVSVLHRFIFEKILKVDHYEYEKEASDTVERARSGSYEAAFFLNSTKIHELKEVALAGHRMPPKSTYFYPKLLTGMVIYKY